MSYVSVDFWVLNSPHQYSEKSKDSIHLSISLEKIDCFSIKITKNIQTKKNNKIKKMVIKIKLNSLDIQTKIKQKR